MAFDIEQYKNEDSMEFEEAVEAVGNGRFHLRMVSVGGLALLSSYVAISGISFVLPASQCDLHMDSIDKGNLISAGFLGLILSCHMWGFLSDRLGRHYIIIRSLFFDGLLYIITSLTPYYRVILILRFFNGIASSGGIVSLYAYVGEFYTSKTRMKALMIMSLIGCGSYFILPVVAWGILTSKWSFVLYPGFTFKPWRLYYAILGLPSLSCCLLLYFLPESPKFLLAKGDKKRAIKVFEKIYNENNNIKNHQQQFFIKNVTISDSEKLTKVDDNTNKVVAVFTLLWDQTAPLFKRPHRFCMVLVCVTQYLLYMSFGGVYLWLPETMNRLAIFKEENVNQPATYCQVVQFRANHDLSNNLTETNIILKTLNNDIKYNNNNNDIANGETCSDSIDFSVYVNLEILGILQATACVVVLILVKYFDKRYVICCCIFSSFCAILCLLYLKIIEVIPLLANLVVILTGVTIPTLNSAVVDLFPTNLRAMASCLILMFSRIGTVTTNTLAGSLIDLHCSLLLWIFVVSFIVCFILVILLPKKPPYLEEEENRINEKF